MQERSTGQYGASSTQSQDKLRDSDKIIGMDIMSANNEKIGTVDDLFVDMESGKILAVVASTGSVLGMGGQRALLSTEDLRLNGENKHLRSELTKEQLESAPVFSEGQSNQFDNVLPLNRSTGSLRHSSERGSEQPTANRGASERTTSRSTERAAARGSSSERAGYGTQAVATSKNLAVTDLVGMNVENRVGDKIGSIDKIYIDLEGGQVIGAVVSTGGFLGIGAHQNVLALSEFNYDAEGQKLHADLSRDQLRNAPTYKAGDPAWHTALRERSNRGGQSDTARRTQTGSTRTSEQTDSARSTVFNQGNSSAETKMTADIRSAIRGSDNMSTRANNVTIITKEKKVLLRGNVDSENEKSAIEEIAHEKAGDDNVTSELVVVTR